MKLFALALLAASASAQAAPIANEAAPECYNVTPAAHFCSCGGDGFGEQTLVRIDISNGQRIVSRLQNFYVKEECQTMLFSGNHPACR